MVRAEQIDGPQKQHREDNRRCSRDNRTPGQLLCCVSNDRRPPIVDIGADARQCLGGGDAVERQPTVVDRHPAIRVTRVLELVLLAVRRGRQQDVLVDRQSEVAIGRVSSLENRESVDARFGFVYPQRLAVEVRHSQRRGRDQTRQQENSLERVPFLPTLQVIHLDDSSIWSRVPAKALHSRPPLRGIDHTRFAVIDDAGCESPGKAVKTRAERFHRLSGLSGDARPFSAGDAKESPRSQATLSRSNLLQRVDV